MARIPFSRSFGKLERPTPDLLANEPRLPRMTAGHYAPPAPADATDEDDEDRMLRAHEEDRASFVARRAEIDKACADTLDAALIGAAPEPNPKRTK